MPNLSPGLARVRSIGHAVARARARPSRCAGAGRVGTPRCRRCASRCAIEPPAASRSARSCWTCRSRSPHGGARYDEAAHDRLFELFGPPDRWGTTLRTLLWTRTTLVVPPFTGRTVVDLARALHLRPRGRRRRGTSTRSRDGEVPLEFLFSGSVFYPAPTGGCRPRGSPWEQEAEYRLPVAVWTGDDGRATSPARPGCGCAKDAFDRLAAYKARARAADLGRRGRRAAGREDAVSVDPVRRDRRRGPLRGLRAVAVPALGAEEPAPLDVRRRLPARATAERHRTTAAPMRAAVPARGRRRRASTCGCASCTSCAARCVARRRAGRRARRSAGERHLAWDEAVEREVGGRRPSVRGRRPREPAERGPRATAARRAHAGRRCAGARRGRAERLGDGLRRLTVDGRATRRRGTATTARRRCGARSARPTPCCARRRARSSR